MYLAALSCKPQRLVVVWLSVAMALINGLGRYQTLNGTPLCFVTIESVIVQEKILFGLVLS